MMMTNNTENHLGKTTASGFTIIEVMIAMAIFSIGILAVAAMQVSSTKTNNISRASTQAYNLAQQYMEAFLNADYNDPNIADVNAANNADLTTTNLANVDYFNVDVTGAAVNLGPYDLIVNVADNTPINDTKTVVVIISWRAGRQSRSITCIKALSA